MLSPYWPFLYKLSIALHSYDFMLREIRVGHGSGQVVSSYFVPRHYGNKMSYMYI